MNSKNKCFFCLIDRFWNIWYFFFQVRIVIHIYFVVFELVNYHIYNGRDPFFSKGVFSREVEGTLPKIYKIIPGTNKKHLLKRGYTFQAISKIFRHRQTDKHTPRHPNTLNKDIHLIFVG